MRGRTIETRGDSRKRDGTERERGSKRVEIEERK